ncbi:hypothetical protein CDL15_Pgr009111 [Punica granatum]|uniref:Uncharacterized protein n=1 Tax=Punica granatum TaxID=22663 RepID=A0A218VZT0_PUNGR|nr:hypothetical protein CDL15_Pgr009111 [Punica granatum]
MPKTEESEEEMAVALGTAPLEEKEGEEQGQEEEEEEVLVALIEHRTKEVKNLRHRVAYYTSQLKEAEKRLHDTERRLGRLQDKDKAVKISLKSESGRVRPHSSSPVPHKFDPSRHTQPSKPKLFIPSPNQSIAQESQVAVSGTKDAVPSNARAILSASHAKGAANLMDEKSFGQSSDCAAVAIQDKGTKRKFVLWMEFSTCGKFKQKGRSGASLLSSSDCVSPSQRRWPEDIAWHPWGDRIFSAYSADGGDSQISVINLNKSHRRAQITFLEDKPHVKGIINSIVFLPGEDNFFITGGSDHAVILWNPTEEESSWKPKALHRNLHSSAVMGVAGMLQKDVILSAGADRKILGFDIQAGKPSFRHQIESKCMSILPNPCDFNLFMVQTGTPESQLRLFDIRLRQTEVHAFGWKQESSESQSALINQAWSPDGLFITSGSADPMIHIFDIRYNARRPSQSVKAHQKRVFKAVWHQRLPLLISISSDLSIGMHKII